MMQCRWRESALLRQGLRVQVLLCRKRRYLFVSYRFAETVGGREWTEECGGWRGNWYQIIGTSPHRAFVECIIAILSKKYAGCFVVGARKSGAYRKSFHIVSRGMTSEGLLINRQICSTRPYLETVPTLSRVA